MDILATLPFIYDAALSDTKWGSALDNLASASSARGVMLLAESRFGPPYSVQTSNGLYVGREEEVSRYFELYRRYEEEGLSNVWNAAPLTPVRDVDMWPNLKVLRHREDIVCSKNLFGIFRRLSFNLSTNAGWRSGIVLQYPHDQQHISRKLMQDATILMPHVSKVVELNRFYHKLQEQYHAVLSVLDNVRIAVCVADSTGRLVIVNKQAHRLFEDNDGLSTSRERRFICTHDGLRAQLQHLITSACETAVGDNDACEATLIIPRRSGYEPFLIEISPLRDSEAEYQQGFSGALVTIIDPKRPPCLRATPLKELCGFSPAETAIAQFLVDGHSTEVIAETRGVTPHTVRTQIKLLLQKAGVTSRSELIRKVIGISPPIGNVNHGP